MRFIIQKIKKWLGIKSDQDIINEYEDIVKSSQKQDNIPPPKEGAGYQCKVLFIVSDDGNILLDINWDKPEEIIAENLGNLLYAINNGIFENSCINVITNEAIKNPGKAEFVKKCLESYNNKKKDRVLIKPSEVFSVNHFQDPVGGQ